MFSRVKTLDSNRSKLRRREPRRRRNEDLRRMSANMPLTGVTQPVSPSSNKAWMTTFTLAEQALVSEAAIIVSEVEFRNDMSSFPQQVET